MIAEDTFNAVASLKIPFLDAAPIGDVIRFRYHPPLCAGEGSDEMAKQMADFLSRELAKVGLKVATCSRYGDEITGTVGAIHAAELLGTHAITDDARLEVRAGLHGKAVAWFQHSENDWRWCYLRHVDTAQDVADLCRGLNLPMLVDRRTGRQVMTS